MASRPGKKKTRPTLFEGFRVTAEPKGADEVKGPPEKKMLDSYQPSRHSKLPPHMMVTSLPKVGAQAPKPPNSVGGSRPGAHVQQDASIVTGRALVVDADSVVLEMSKTAQVVATVVLVLLLGGAFALGALIGGRAGWFGDGGGVSGGDNTAPIKAGTGVPAAVKTEHFILIKSYKGNQYKPQATIAHNRLTERGLQVSLGAPVVGGERCFLLYMGPYAAKDSPELTRDMQRLRALNSSLSQAINCDLTLSRVVDGKELTAVLE